jgi:hypothetical protein
MSEETPHYGLCQAAQLSQQTYEQLLDVQHELRQAQEMLFRVVGNIPPTADLNPVQKTMLNLGELGHDGVTYLWAVMGQNGRPLAGYKQKKEVKG